MCAKYLISIKPQHAVRFQNGLGVTAIPLGKFFSHNGMTIIMLMDA